MVACFFADAWHEWHMEVFGEHADVYTVQVQKKHLTKGAEAKRATARRRDGIILRCVSDMISKTAAHIARYRFDEVNAALQNAGMPPVKSELAFAKQITRIKESRKREPDAK